MRYTKDSIDKVREADIVKTIEHFENLKKEGANYKCKSPFTSEKTASFVVSPSKQIFKCFSSRIAGDGLKFVIEKCKVDFIEAVEKVASIHNILLEKEEVSPEREREINEQQEMHAFLNSISKKYVSTFRKLDNNHWAKEMIESREFSESMCIEFQIGFAPKGNVVVKWASENATFSLAKNLGICNTKNNKSYDVFQNRIIFPIHNHRGIVVGFGGRASNNHEDEKWAKYVNSSESQVYNKSKILYGLFQSKQNIAQTGTAILTEGYTDVISMHQNGCTNTVASCGTALTEDHAILLKKYAQEVILLRDGDPAGIKATLRDIDICLHEGLNVNLCLLPEGEDPDSFARNLTGNMQDWIKANKIDALLWKVAQYDTTRDNYHRDIDELKKLQSEAVSNLMADIIDKKTLKNKKGLSLAEAKKHNKQIFDQIDRIKKETRLEIKNLTKIDPSKKSRSFNEIVKVLFNIQNQVKRTEYIKLIAKQFDVTTGTLKTAIDELEKKATEAKKSKTGTPMQNIRLPKGADKQEYMEHGFVTIGNSYFFQNRSGGFFQGSNYKLTPLYHIQGDKENKRLCEITNLQGKKRLIDFDSDMLANFNEFRKYLFRIGGFRFLTHNGMNSLNFDEFVNRYDDEFEPALELLTMGWNTKGFWAFADGVHWKGKFQRVNKYGIMHLEGVSTIKTDYNDKIDYYYSPAFSVMHADNQDGDDKYENDRSFVYKESPIDILQWQKQMILVFQEKGIGGILFNFASIFRDLFLEHYDFFPLMAGFGEKDSGKSAFGKILQNFFYYRLPPLDLTQATHVGFSRRMSRNINTVQFLDEYQDKQIDDKIFSGMMGGWNGIGREKGMNTGDKRTVYDKINSAIYYAGQFMPTRMENALATRTVSFLFQNRDFTPQEKENFNQLLKLTNQGLSSLVVDIVQHRAYFEKRLPLVHLHTVRNLKEALEGKEYQERIFGNVAVLLTTFNILRDKIDFTFTEQEVQTLCEKLIIENSEQISDSNGLTEFWNILTFLFEMSYIKEGIDFNIEKPVDFKILVEKRKEVKVENQERKNILFLRLKSVYQHYNKEVTKREGIDVIGQTTLRQYFKSRSYFIGLVKAKYFTTAGGQSCYAFDYDAMQKLGLTTLEKFDPQEYNNENDMVKKVKQIEDNNDDLPF